MKNTDLKWPYNFLAEINKRIDAHDKLPECEDDAPEDIEEVLEYIFARMRHCTAKCRILGSTFVQEYYRFGSSMSDIAVDFGITRSCVSAYICKAIEYIGGCETYRAMIRLGISYNFFHNFKKIRDEAYTLGYDHGYAAGCHSVITVKEPLSRDSDIENCDFSIRTYMALKRNGIETIADLLSTDDKTLMSFRNLGKKCLEEIHEFIDGYKTDNET